jgi:succinyl-CoA synthetase alpha subunit
MAILVDGSSRIVVQGITGREAASFTKDMIDYGSQVTGGVTPGKGGWDVHGVPVYDSVRQAMAETPANTSIISVPPAGVKGAAFEALEAGMKLLVIITERVPRRDVVELLEYADEAGARVVGPNTLGIISPGPRVKVGMAGGPAADVDKAYSPGPVGILSRSGGMTTEIANLLTTHGIGQSTCVGIGGDPIIGSNFVDLVPLFEKDPGTKAVVLYCEPGGIGEEQLSDYVLHTGCRLPIVAFVAGQFVDDMPGVRFGHAGAIVEGDRGSTRGKIKRFKEAGIQVAERFSDIVGLVNAHL